LRSHRIPVSTANRGIGNIDILGSFSARPVCRLADTDSTITFIFFVPANSIDFIRRYGECWSRWVVDDIGTTIDFGTVKDLSARYLGIADPCELVFLRRDQLLTGCDLGAAVSQPWQ
jgi:hypothetical protein